MITHEGIPLDKEPVRVSMDDQVEQIKQKVIKAWESPIDTLARTVDAFNEEEDEGSPSDNRSVVEMKPQPTIEELKLQLQSLIEAIANASSMDELYAPTLENVFENVEVDDMTKNFLTYSLSHKKHAKRLEKHERPPSRRANTSSKSKQYFYQYMLIFLIDSMFYVMGSLSEERKRQLGELISTIDLNVFNHTEEELFHMLHIIFETEFELLSAFDIPEELFFRFLKLLKENYFAKNPYHNFYHAVDVAQTLFVFLKRTGVTTYLSKLELFAILCAALCHDGNNYFSLSN